MLLTLLAALTIYRLPFFVPAPDEPLATLNGRVIIAREALTPVANDLRYYAHEEADAMRSLRADRKTPSEVREKLEAIADERYDLVRRALEDYLQRAILDDEAKLKGVTVDGLFKPFDRLRDVPVEPTDIDRFVAARNIDRSKLTTQDLESIPQIIRMQRVYEARQAYMEKLRRDANVEIFLVRPGVRFAPVEVRPAESAGTGPIVVTVVTDFECPFSKRRVGDVHAWAKKNGDVTVSIRHLPIERIHPYARLAAEASICAARQGKFWDYHDWLFEKQDELMGEEEEFQAAAQRMGMEGASFHDCLASHAATAEVDSDLVWAQAVGIRSTPSFFVNGVRARDESDVSLLIEEARDHARRK